MASLDEKAEYVVEIEGCVDGGVVDRIGPVTMVSRPHGDGLITTLSGIIADQAGMVGLVRYLHGLGIVLLSLKRIERA